MFLYYIFYHLQLQEKYYNKNFDSAPEADTLSLRTKLTSLFRLPKSLIHEELDRFVIGELSYEIKKQDFRYYESPAGIIYSTI